MENYAAALEEILRLKPSAAKGRYIKKADDDDDGPEHPGRPERGPQPDRGARRGLTGRPPERSPGTTRRTGSPAGRGALFRFAGPLAPNAMDT